MNTVSAMLEQLLPSGGLPDPLPAEPIALLQAWLTDAEASGKYPDHNAMTLATAAADGRPSARIVLCKSIDADPPSLVFFTNYRSRKGRELEHNPAAAAVFHWAHHGRQARVEGRVQRLADAENAAYFEGRPLLSRLGAWASRQSEPLGSRSELVTAVAKLATKYALRWPLITSKESIPRPPHWGGYRLVIESIELWAAGEGRLHDRIVWNRTGPAAAPEQRWHHQRLYP